MKSATKRKPKPPKLRVVSNLPAPLPRPKTLAEVCYAASRDPKVNVDKMRAVMQLATEQEWVESMLAAQAEIAEHKIIKDAWNPHTKSWYPKLENIQKVVDPIARKHGFALSYGMSDSPLDDHYRVICDVRHRNSHTKQYVKDIGMDTAGPKGGGTKSPAQGSGSSSAYGKRYLLVDIFNVIIVGADDDGAGGRKATITKKQVNEITAALKDGGPNEARFLAAYGVEKIADLLATDFDQAMGRIKTYKANRAAAAEKKE